MVPNDNRNSSNDSGQVDSRLESLHSDGTGEWGVIKRGYDCDIMVIKEIC